jgi:hypothetical protein
MQDGIVAGGLRLFKWLLQAAAFGYSSFLHQKIVSIVNSIYIR